MEFLVSFAFDSLFFDLLLTKSISTTVWNVVITVLSLFVFLVKVVLYISKGFPPIVSAIVHSIILALWLGSVSQQAGPDYIDAKHPSKFPWYLTRGCGAPVSLKVQSGCKMTVGGFAVSICLS